MAADHVALRSWPRASDTRAKEKRYVLATLMLGISPLLAQLSTVFRETFSARAIDSGATISGFPGGELPGLSFVAWARAILGDRGFPSLTGGLLWIDLLCMVPLYQGYPEVNIIIPSGAIPHNYAAESNNIFSSEGWIGRENLPIGRGLVLRHRIVVVGKEDLEMLVAHVRLERVEVVLCGEHVGAETVP